MNNTISKPCIVCYDPAEFDGISKALTCRESMEIPGLKHQAAKGRLASTDIHLVRLPFGNKPEELRRNIEIICTILRPEIIISLGTAMAVSDCLKIGNLCLISSAVQNDRKEFFSPELTDALRKASDESAKSRPELAAATLETYTSSVFIQTPEQLRQIKEDYPSIKIVEMEDYHLAAVTSSFQIKCASIRAISDYGNFKQHMDSLSILIPNLIALAESFIESLPPRKQLMQYAVNPSISDMPYRIAVNAPGKTINIPQAFNIVKKTLRELCIGEVLNINAFIEINLEKSVMPDTEPSFDLFLEESGNFARLDISDRFVTEKQQPLSQELLQNAKCSSIHLRSVKTEEIKKPSGKLHIQGLNSISAEAVEGLLAAATIDEFESDGFEISTSDNAGIWMYRTASVSQTSYFAPHYGIPMRKSDKIPENVFLIVTGLGPAIDPGASGGSEADLMILGDEQCNRLKDYLKIISSENFKTSDAFRFPGIIHKINSSTVIFNRIDQRQTLTTAGLNSLSFSPESLRIIYSDAYDTFLVNYFDLGKRHSKAKATRLFFTSRGCGRRCSICCSGGYQQYTTLETARFIDVLKSFKEFHNLQSGEYIDVFLLDSNLNQYPERLDEIADCLEKENLKSFFNFHVRHNELKSFIKGTDHVNHKLIEAYSRLGINEIVIGIDSYTDSSVRILKTDFQKILKYGEKTEPIYSFNDIENVIGAIDAKGIKSRCFLLFNNPFTGSDDRIRTYYNLLKLALKFPGFMIDLDSSPNVNEIKPFPGAPLTDIAQDAGLIIDGVFAPDGLTRYVEKHLDLRLFNSRRFSEEQKSELLSRWQQVRLNLAEALLKKLENACNLKIPQVLLTVKTFVSEDDKLIKEFEQFGSDLRLLEVKKQIRNIISPDDLPPDNLFPGRESIFFKITNSWSKNHPTYKAKKKNSESEFESM
ncbi:MAG: hypothetical protein HQM10_14025 [Candidatus Riflebacteria bacterium]|nr:hypothetical protein [Candidatus Riflebacteria bacterium]